MWSNRHSTSNSSSFISDSILVVNDVSRDELLWFIFNTSRKFCFESSISILYASSFRRTSPSSSNTFCFLSLIPIEFCWFQILPYLTQAKDRFYSLLLCLFPVVFLHNFDVHLLSSHMAASVPENVEVDFIWIGIF